jgi:hypothetical protein
VVAAVGAWQWSRSFPVRSPVRRLATSQPTAPRPQFLADAGAAQTAMVAPNERQELAFLPRGAELSGGVRLETMGGADVLTSWLSPEAQARWQFRVPKPAFFRAEVTYATADNAADAEVEFVIDDRPKSCGLRSSGGPDSFVSDIFTMAVRESGRHTLALRTRRSADANWLVLKSVRFIPIRANLTTDAP